MRAADSQCFVINQKLAMRAAASFDDCFCMVDFFQAAGFDRVLFNQGYDFRLQPLVRQRLHINKVKMLSRLLSFVSNVSAPTSTTMRGYFLIQDRFPGLAIHH